MHKTLTLSLLGFFFIACDSATAPVIPSEAPTDNVVGATASPVYTGQGTAVDATIAGVNTKLCDTGPLARTGGRIENASFTASVTGVLSAAKLYCITTSVDNNRVISEATLWNFSLTIGGNTIAADKLHSMAAGRCPPLVSAPFSSGTAFVTNLRINGRSITVRANTTGQRFELPNGSLVFNEQVNFVSPWHAGRTVIGLRVVINTPERSEVILSRSQAHIDCP